MGKPKYWAVGHTFDKEDKTEEFLNEGYWYDGYSDNDIYTYADILKQIEIGDVFCLKSSSFKGPGKTIRFTRLKHIGVVTGRESEYCFWVNWLPNDKLPKDFDQINYGKTIEKMRDDKMLKFVRKEVQIYQGVIEMDDFISLVEANKNVIFTGAPGTGKTFLAKKIALKLIFGKDFGKDNEELLSEEEEAAFKKQCRFVQFHPSYDYTDFVEGLRPADNGSNESIGFKIRDGIFKEFCKDALTYSSSNEQNHHNFDEAWDKLIDELIEKKEISIPTITRSSSQKYTLSSKNSLKFLNISAGTLTKENIYNVFAGYKGRESNAYQNYMKSIVKYLKDNHGLKDYDAKPEEQKKNFVFVIDEINRGEISKIFGELFFSIDPPYRGPKGTVQTQYTNMLSYDDVFKNGFYVPENVFIIGTMNDIDRSVESFDFAMRRRFVWHEIKAEESAKNMKLLEPTVERMNALNKAITDIPGLNSSYNIGAWYFLKKENNNVVEPDYQSLWKLRLKPLLWEYLRGMQDAQEHLDKLKKAFDLVQ